MQKTSLPKKNRLVQVELTPDAHEMAKRAAKLLGHSLRIYCGRLVSEHAFETISGYDDETIEKMIEDRLDGYAEKFATELNDSFFKTWMDGNPPNMRTVKELYKQHLRDILAIL